MSRKKPPIEPEQNDHEARVAEGAKKMRRVMGELLDVYRNLDRLLTSIPLKSVTGYTDHHEHASLIRDIALRAWREVESTQDEGPRKTPLAVLEGGKTS